MSKKIVIVGGGFGGVRAALDLSKNISKDVKIVLISDKRHFEYYPSLYKIATGKSPLEVCMPLDEIFSTRGGSALGRFFQHTIGPNTSILEVRPRIAVKRNRFIKIKNNIPPYGLP